MLLIKGIAKRYKHKSILDQLHFNFPAQSISALVGANGVGKSTLVKIICGLVKQDNGEVIFQNQDITKLSIANRIQAGLGYLSQTNTLIQDLSVEDNLYLIPQIDQSDVSYRDGLLADFGLTKIRHQKCRTLSGGEARKLEFCRCMATRPTCVLLDEPFSGLDPKTTNLVLQILKSQNKKGISFIIADHRINELRKVASHYILLHDTQAAFTGSPDEFFSSLTVKTNFLGEE